MCTFWNEALFCSGGFELVSYLFSSRPVHTMRLVSYDSFVLLCWNPGNDLWISEFERSCVRTKTKTLSAFSLSPHVQVLQTLTRSFLKFINWALNKFSTELNKRLVNWFYYCIIKELPFSEIFVSDLVDNNQVMQSTWQTCFANATSWVSGKLDL